MWTECIDRNHLDYAEELIDESRLRLYIRINEEQPSEEIYLANLTWFKEKILNPLLEEYIIDAFVDYKDAPTKVFTERIYAYFEKYRRVDFGFDAYRKTDKIKTKTARTRYANKIIDNLGCTEYSTKKRTAVIKSIRDELAAEFNEEYFHEMYDRLLNIGRTGKLNAVFLSEVSLGMDLYTVKNKVIQGEIMLDISPFSANDNINKLADELKELLKEYCNMFPHSYGFVGMVRDGFVYTSEGRECFVDVESGETECFGTNVDVDEYLNYWYIDDLDWFTVIPSYIGQKLKCNASIETENYKFTNNGNNYYLESKMDILSHKLMLYSECYSNFKNCIRPGFGEYVIPLKNEIIPGGCIERESEDDWHIEMPILGYDFSDAYIPKECVEMKDDKIRVRRGDFKFLTTVCENDGILRMKW